MVLFSVLAIPVLAESQTDGTRAKFAGDIWGARSGLAQRGILYDAQLTQFHQGVASGGQEQTFEYCGKFDQFVFFDFETLGLCERLKATMHAETKFGKSVIGDATPLAEVNVNMLYPQFGTDDTAITGLLFEYALENEWCLLLGKVNALDFFYALYPETGRGVDGFMNASVILPLTLGRTIPLAFLGTAVLKRRGSRIEGGLLVYDSHNCAMTSGFDRLFENGVNMAGLWRFFTELNGLEGSHLFLVTGATGKFPTPNPLGWQIATTPKTGAWTLTYILEQKLWVDPGNKNRNFGVLSEWGLADPRTHHLRWVANLQLQGQGLLGNREHDTMGVGYFYSGLSGEFKRLNPAVPVHDLQGVELYYNAAIKPWFHFTADLQVIEPAVVARDTAIVFGIRAKIDI